MAVRFLHAADIHLGCEQYGEHERANDFARTFGHLVDTAIDRSVAFVLLAGDLFHRADISPQTAGQVKRMAAEAWRAIDCYGMARIDFFLADDQRLLLSEINTIPGFVSISMYPRLFRAAGYRDGELLEKLIGLALTREDK